MTPQNYLRGRSFLARGKRNYLRGSFVWAIVVVWGAETALACPVCFRVEENATTHGAQAAVLVLIGVTTVVLGAFARFIIGFVARDAANHEGEPRGHDEVHQ
jgi:hypothetical protein